ncbi:unnamed protein product [Protopolystoma xenopodis]|uniref:Uncharacterized protein n=1 Tax=Protopolystoma xenopodis TaxID=117903 RepID=A0A3S5B9J5_9PLAT|nr:unnamed protein product [Protopolystoma xenopodis]
MVPRPRSDFGNDDAYNGLRTRFVDASTERGQGQLELSKSDFTGARGLRILRQLKTLEANQRKREARKKQSCCLPTIPQNAILQFIEKHINHFVPQYSAFECQDRLDTSFIESGHTVLRRLLLVLRFDI